MTDAHPLTCGCTRCLKTKAAKPRTRNEEEPTGHTHAVCDCPVGAGTHHALCPASDCRQCNY
jgi:hypothetical protein